ncbi:MAG: hypothetical protein M1814_005255 [Vezdaea aestivalis]|nr:MAG: hypothetical protein M1814_005255 [Vezdaea aestivalis]
MHLKAAVPLALAAFTTLSKAHQSTTADICFFACQDSTGSITFNTTEETDDYYTGAAMDTYRWQSTCLCVMQRCSKEDQVAGYKTVAEDFAHYGHVTVPTCLEWTSNLTDSNRDNPYMLDLENFQSEKIINSTAMPIWATPGFWAIVTILGVIYRIFTVVINHKAMKQTFDPEHGTSVRGYGPIGKVRAFIRSRFILPALFRHRHQDAFGWCSIPTRLQSFIVGSFVFINLILCCVNYRAHDNNIFWDTKSKQTWRYISDRAGILSYSNLPFLFLFATRNNFLMLLTGWEFATFQVLHKWVARQVIHWHTKTLQSSVPNITDRVATIQGIVHSVGYSVDYWAGYSKAEYIAAFKERYWYTGVIGICAMSFMLLFAFYSVRQRIYDFFLYTHVALAILTVVALWYHTVDYGVTDSYNAWFITPSIVVWFLDRLIRFLRVLVVNYKALWAKHDKATATYDAQHDMIRLSITPSFHRKVEPGSYYFLYFPTTLALGNHPFTLSSWSYGGTDDGALSLTSSNEAPTPTSIKKPTASTVEIKPTKPAGPLSLTFLIRPYRGLTRRLKNNIIRSGSFSKPVRVLIEGPYGPSHPVFNYQRVLFCTGGTGITPVLAYMQHYAELRSKRVSRHAPKALFATKAIHIIWAARQAAFAHSVLDNELRNAKARPEVTLDIFVTGKAKSDQEDDLGLAENEAKGLHLPQHHRPDVGVVVTEAIIEAKAAGESLAVFVCGPAKMADSARRSIVDGAAGGTKVEYFEEQFGW